MILVDTSSWIEQLRRDGDPTVRKRVEAILSAGEAAWCPIVRLELWNGARGEREKRVLREMEKSLPDLGIPPAVWSSACRLAEEARKKGKTIPSTDLLIAACARHYSVAIEHADSHFEIIAGL